MEWGERNESKRRERKYEATRVFISGRLYKGCHIRKDTTAPNLLSQISLSLSLFSSTGFGIAEVWEGGEILLNKEKISEQPQRVPQGSNPALTLKYTGDSFFCPTTPPEGQKALLPIFLWNGRCVLLPTWTSVKASDILQYFKELLQRPDICLWELKHSNQPTTSNCLPIDGETKVKDLLSHPIDVEIDEAPIYVLKPERTLSYIFYADYYNIIQPISVGSLHSSNKVCHVAAGLKSLDPSNCRIYLEKVDESDVGRRVQFKQNDFPYDAIVLAEKEKLLGLIADYQFALRTETPDRIKVYMEDDTMRVINVYKDSTAADVCQMMCQKLLKHAADWPSFSLYNSENEEIPSDDPIIDYKKSSSAEREKVYFFRKREDKVYFSLREVLSQNYKELIRIHIDEERIDHFYVSSSSTFWDACYRVCTDAGLDSTTYAIFFETPESIQQLEGTDRISDFLIFNTQEGLTTRFVLKDKNSVSTDGAVDYSFSSASANSALSPSSLSSSSSSLNGHTSAVSEIREIAQVFLPDGTFVLVENLDEQTKAFEIVDYLEKSLNCILFSKDPFEVKTTGEERRIDDDENIINILNAWVRDGNTNNKFLLKDSTRIRRGVMKMYLSDMSYMLIPVGETTQIADIFWMVSDCLSTRLNKFGLDPSLFDIFLVTNGSERVLEDDEKPLAILNQWIENSPNNSLDLDAYGKLVYKLNQQVLLSLQQESDAYN